MRKKSTLIYPELSYKLTGILFKIHNELSRFCREKQYGDLIEIKLKEADIKYEREKEIPFNLTDCKIKGNRVDFYIEDKILLDLKAKKFLQKDDFYQMKRYLEATGLKLGVLVNFRDTFLKPHRVLNSKSSVDSHFNS